MRITPTCICLLVSFLALQSKVTGQPQSLPDKSIVDANESQHIANLKKTGEKIRKKNVVAWFPKDSLSNKRMRRIVDTLRLGVQSVESFIHAPFPGLLHKKGSTYTIYFRPDPMLAHGTMKGEISIPFWRIKNGTAPWLHELAHEMLNTEGGNWEHPGMPEEEANNRIPLWLLEGMAEYIANQVSLSKGFPKYDPHSKSFATNADSLFLLDLKNEKGDYVLSYIGRNGLMPELFSKDRLLYTPAFYHGSCSFVKYLVEQYGLNTLLTAMAAFAKEQETIEQLKGKSLMQLKAMWLSSLRR